MVQTRATRRFSVDEYHRLGEAGVLAGDELQPDIALLRPRSDFYEDTLSGPGGVLLVIEVADSSTSYDRNVKLPLYAQAGVPEAWLVGLRRCRLEVFRDPEGGRYLQHVVLGREESLAPLAFPEMLIRAAEILG